MRRAFDMTGALQILCRRGVFEGAAYGTREMGCEAHRDMDGAAPGA
jgi:hypothetical protein